MDEVEYAMLSLKAGLFAGVADEHLGRPHFGTKLRARAWSLTPELVRQYRDEAIAMGVPETALNEAVADDARLSRMIAFGMDAQKQVDAGGKLDLDELCARVEQSDALKPH